jgi:hypothetical protein
VKNSIALLIGAIAKHEFPNQSWPELMQFLQQRSSSDNMSPKELGVYTLSVIPEVTRKQFLPYAKSVAFLLSNTLNSVQDFGSPLAYYTVLTMIHFAALAGGEQASVNMYQQLMPRLMQTCQSIDCR